MIHLKFASRLILLSSILLWTVFEQSQAQSLQRYSCIVERVDIDGWLSDSVKQFDENGILKVDTNYHPVSIGYFGILSLDRYETTGDELYLKYSTDQLNYFESSILVDELFGGKGIGLPYKFEYNGLAPPWYSGMAQGLAISFLLRHADVTNDTSIYPLVEKLAYTMLMPQKDGGCLSRTDENLLWIEEYPNTPESPQVLNGVRFALFGRIDYCEIFPADLRAKRILQDCIVSLKTALPYYDQRSWTKYNRRPLYPNRLHYLRLQVFQLIQLHRIIKDPFYLRQACIWSAMLYDKEPDMENEWIHFNDEPIASIGTLTESEIITNFSKDTEYHSFEKPKIRNGSVPEFPWYGFVTTQETAVETPKTLFIEIDSAVGETHILYRYHWDEELFAQEKWQAQNGVTSNRATFQLEPGHYQFAIFYENNDFPAESKLKRFEKIDR